jgi:septal ring factor EnvC (AmiA/AmiB activator)
MNPQVCFRLVGSFVASWALLVLASCDNPYGLTIDDVKLLQEQVQSTHDELSAKLREIEKLQAEKKDLLKQVEDLTKDNQALNGNLHGTADELKKVRETADQTRGELEKLKKEFNAYREQYRAAARKKIAGETYATLATTDGKTYSGVTITKADSAYVYFSHSSGAAKAAIPSLPPQFAKRLDYAPADPQP